MKNTHLARKQDDNAKAGAYFLEFYLESVCYFTFPTLKLFRINSDKVQSFTDSKMGPLLLLTRAVSRKMFDWSRFACFRKYP
jgi:hypothetical protein